MIHELVVGIEVHSQLLTNSKMFCGCNAEYQASEPNSHTCPVCLGLPGALPVANRRAVEYTIRVGLALHCTIATTTKWDRKNYHYPDLPKGYQISQFDMPICTDGWLDIPAEGGGTRRVGIRRVHLEEDTGRLVHAVGRSLVDYNRSGVPLIEIVSEPDIRSPEEARAYLQKLHAIIRYLGVGSGDLESGAMRMEPNVSIRTPGSEQMGVPVEVKNLNSFRAVKLALEYEQQRQGILLTRGAAVARETRGWVEGRGETASQRPKEEADDYRYFPEPDLPPLQIDPVWVEEIRATMPELPDARADRFQREFALSRYDAGVLTAERSTADWFEAAVVAGGAERIGPKQVANWITGELFRLSGLHGQPIEALSLSPEGLIELILLVEKGSISQNVGKQVLAQMVESEQSAADIVEAAGLAQISDEERLAARIDAVLADHPEAVAKFQEGKGAVLGFLMGQVMRATDGRANPAMVRELLTARLAGTE